MSIINGLFWLAVLLCTGGILLLVKGANIPASHPLGSVAATDREVGLCLLVFGFLIGVGLAVTVMLVYPT